MTTPPRLVHHFLENSALRFPSKTAIIHGQKRLPYDQINRLSNQLAHCLIKAGVGPGDRVALLCESSAEYVSCFYGILKAGAVAVPINVELKPDSLAGLLDTLDAEILIASSRFELTVRPFDPSRFRLQRILVIHPATDSPGLSGPFKSLDDELPYQPDGDPDLDIRPDSCAAIIFTSGSEGKPKGVMLSHINLVENTKAIVESLTLTADDVQMVVLPFYYVMGMSLLNTHFSVGGTLVINNQFAYTAAVLKQMAEERVTGFSGVPSTYAHLLFKAPLARYRDRLPALRYCSQAGGHMPQFFKLELLKVLPPQTRLIVMYGATEASARLTVLPPESLKAKIDSIGRPIAGVTLDVLSPEGQALRAGQVGELVARGKNIMLGYYRDDAATRRVLDRQGYHTGDLGYYDEDGFYYVTGRKDDQVKIDGRRVNPREIEDVILESGQAMECLIFAVPDAYGGQKLAGLAVPVGDASDTAERVVEYCRGRLPKYQVPRPLLLVDELPKNSNGKLDRIAARRLFEERLRRGGDKGSVGIRKC